MKSPLTTCAFVLAMVGCAERPTSGRASPGDPTSGQDTAVAPRDTAGAPTDATGPEADRSLAGPDANAEADSATGPNGRTDDLDGETAAHDGPGAGGDGERPNLNAGTTASETPARNDATDDATDMLDAEATAAHGSHGRGTEEGAAAALAQRGRRAFDRACASCHQGSRRLTGRRLAPASVRRQVRSGGGRMTAIPVSRLSEADLRAIVAFLNTTQSSR